MEDNLQNTFDASILRFEVRTPFKINSIPNRFSHQDDSCFGPFRIRLSTPTAIL
jgi:hypothetical protein